MYVKLTIHVSLRFRLSSPSKLQCNACLIAPFVFVSIKEFKMLLPTCKVSLCKLKALVLSIIESDTSWRRAGLSDVCCSILAYVSDLVCRLYSSLHF